MFFNQNNIQKTFFHSSTGTSQTWYTATPRNMDTVYFTCVDTGTAGPPARFHLNHDSYFSETNGYSGSSYNHTLKLCPLSYTLETGFLASVDWQTGSAYPNLNGCLALVFCQDDNILNPLPYYLRLEYAALNKIGALTDAAAYDVIIDSAKSSMPVATCLDAATFAAYSKVVVAFASGSHLQRLTGTSGSSAITWDNNVSTYNTSFSISSVAVVGKTTTFLF